MSIKKLAYEFDPFEVTGIEVPKNRRQEALEEVAQYVKEEVLSYVGDGESPVSGGKFKKSLSPEYKKRKSQQSSSTFANLELSGDMLDALEVIEKRGDALSLQIEGDQAPKADGHNNFSGDSDLPAREFIPNPNKNQTFKRDIWNGIRGILEKYSDDEE